MKWGHSTLEEDAPTLWCCTQSQEEQDSVGQGPHRCKASKGKYFPINTHFARRTQCRKYDRGRIFAMSLNHESDMENSHRYPRKDSGKHCKTFRIHHLGQLPTLSPVSRDFKTLLLENQCQGETFWGYKQGDFSFSLSFYASVMEISRKVSKQDFFFPFPEHCSEGTCMLCGLRAFCPPLAPFWGGWDPTCTWLLQPHWRCSVVKASHLKPSFTDTSSAGLTCFHCLEHWKAT